MAHRTAAPGQGLPSVSVVIATHDRPVLLRRALDAVLAQGYAGAIEVIVVFDGCEVDLSIALDTPDRTVRPIGNTHAQRACRSPELGHRRQPRGVPRLLR